jgi:hypothetical protein
VVHNARGVPDACGVAGGAFGDGGVWSVSVSAAGKAAGGFGIDVERLRKLFSRGTTVLADATKYPTAAEIRGTLDRVHAQVRQEGPAFTAEQLKEPVDMPYAAEATKLGSLLFCSHHEMLHAGQLGLLRRLLGKLPVR